MSTDVRRPELNLEVLWQRHVPSGIGSTAYDDARVDAVADLIDALEHSVEVAGGYEALDRGDLVLTLSVRPLPGGSS